MLFQEIYIYLGCKLIMLYYFRMGTPEKKAKAYINGMKSDHCITFLLNKFQVL